MILTAGTPTKHTRRKNVSPIFVGLLKQGSPLQLPYPLGTSAYALALLFLVASHGVAFDIPDVSASPHTAHLSNPDVPYGGGHSYAPANGAIHPETQQAWHPSQFQLQPK